MSLQAVFGAGLILLSATLAFGEDKGKADSGMDGTWLPSTAELGGQAFPEEVRKSIRLVIKEGKYTVTLGKQEDHGTCKLDAIAKPKALDVTGTEGPNKGKTILAIYERDGDKLTVCYDLSGKARPKEFATKQGTQLFLVTYMRQKK
jgi:uncharacterized protein (TIGR03067 family)